MVRESVSQTEEPRTFNLLFGEFWLRISNFISTGSRSTTSWPRPIWKRTLPCVSGSRISRPDEGAKNFESLVRQILIENLKLYFDRIHIKHQVTNANVEKNLVACQWFSQKVDVDEDFLNDVWFSDEAYFLNYHYNSNNFFGGVGGKREPTKSRWTSSVLKNMHGVGHHLEAQLYSWTISFWG